MHKFLWIIFGFLLCGYFTAYGADNYTLTDGTTVSGDVISFNDDGAIFHTPDDKYTDRIPWTKFSQDALKLLAQNPKIAVYASPFIETPPPVHPETAVRIHSVSRLELPPKQSVVGAMFSSSLGIIVLLLVYAANIYAGMEIAVFRARPVGLVAGISAALPIVGPIIFLSMPTYIPPGATEEDMQTETGAPPQHATPAAASPATPESQAAATSTESVHLAPTGWQTAAAIPETQVFQRGQYTFNRRFFETKFSGFFGMMRHGIDKDMVLTVKTPRAQYIVGRITRIAANEAHFEVVMGAERPEVMVPFGDIQEVQLKHKDA